MLTNDGKSYFECKDGAYRIYKFIENTVALQIAEDKEVFEGAGYAFGNFVKTTLVKTVVLIFCKI